MTEKFATVEEYLAAQSSEFRPALQDIYNQALQTLPQAQACISYNMPCIKQQGMVCYFAAFKKHYSLFFSPVHVRYFEKDLSGFVKGKSAIQVPIGQHFPASLLKKILLHAAEANRIKAEAKKAKNRK